MLRAYHASLTVLIGALLVQSGGRVRARAPAHVRHDAQLVVHCDASTHPISVLVYGIGGTDDEPGQWDVGATARRWGGNRTSRYNWKHGHAMNCGKDWFFENVDCGGEDTRLDERFVEDNLAHGVATALTLPTIGWVAKDTKSYSFPVSLYGAQRATAPENADIGNGVSPGGSLLEVGPPERTSVPMPPSSIGEWVRAIRARDDARGVRGVAEYILDNEPTLWNETHRDVHPEPVSYDELLERTIAYATEVRAADPGAVIAGPAHWGWDACIRSGVDRAHRGRPDGKAHGGVPLLPWWLRGVRAEEKRIGQRLIDIVDVHFYPSGKNIGFGLGGGTDPDTSARRIRATRALWDPTYEDESWIAEPIALVPQLKSWIQENAPGLGVSIGEYNFGAEGHMSGGLAVAEALGRFGALGVTSAYYWTTPAPGSAAFWAFRAYRNFDGAGAHFLDESVDAESNNPAASIYASRDPSDPRHMVLVLLNLDPSASIAAQLDTSSCGNVAGKRTFLYTGGSAGFAPSTAPSLPPYSITVVDLTLAREP